VLEEVADRLEAPLALAVSAASGPGSFPGEEQSADVRPGVIALAARLRQRGEATFAGLAAAWLRGASADFFGTLRDLADAAGHAGQPPREIERKYLLGSLPPRALTVPGEEIEQGWLAGNVLVERLRRIRSARGEEWYRTVKAGSGVSRIELEEATTRELFEYLWPLTEGCRVLKRRYPVPDGELIWEIDQFTDRDLTLAEVELPREGYPVALPEWLAQSVVREVTGERDYLNRCLAK
jgi:CYTH domain-containing protein